MLKSHIKAEKPGKISQLSRIVMLGLDPAVLEWYKHLIDKNNKRQHWLHIENHKNSKLYI